jgi:nucleoside 2-deoxyribosyltransferase
MKIYLAGPMRGIPNFNFPQFDHAAALLRKYGHEVFSPADHDRKTCGMGIEQNPTGDEALAARVDGFDIRKALAADLTFICLEADVIAMLPGWQKSKGATAELATAVALGKNPDGSDKVKQLFLDGEYILK